ncbi:hypothetical protein B0H17DRAFT_1075552 [Mycena rosella]|uniref:Polymerase nucleotidyl transferase domain-containing protein n=1 Tax=Mycena rosella TaxID=1033263 RepID=A0AAD7DAB6_MYCRO|nr:hypothetical protein B0H17DRAFT_1075552 [Mycena rosella]
MPAPEIPSLLKAFQMPTQVHSVHLVGSRLWGTHSERSDFDLLIVVADPVASRAEFQKSQHKGNYDATIITETSFRDHVKSGSLIETLCCLIPVSEECVLVGGDDTRRGLIEKAHLETMRIWADHRAEKDREKAMKFWAKGGEMRERGWKILQHMIAAECILLGLKTIAEEDSTDLRDFRLTQAMLQRLIAAGRQDGDRAWVALDWVDVEEAHAARIQSVGTAGIRLTEN